MHTCTNSNIIALFARLLLNAVRNACSMQCNGWDFTVSSIGRPNSQHLYAGSKLRRRSVKENKRCCRVESHRPVDDRESNPGNGGTRRLAACRPMRSVTFAVKTCIAGVLHEMHTWDSRMSHGCLACGVSGVGIWRCSKRMT